MNTTHNSDDTGSTTPSTPVPTTQPYSRYSLLPLLLAGLFMVLGLTFLVYLGREKARILGLPIADLDIRPLLNTDSGITERDMHGKVTVLHFWGTWCGPCVQEYPEFAKLQKKYSTNPNVIVASISCGTNSPENLSSLEFDTKRFLKEIDDSLPVYCDPTEYSRVQLSRLATRGGFGYPTTIVISRAGTVADYWPYAIEMHELENVIEREISKKAPGS